MTKYEKVIERYARNLRETNTMTAVENALFGIFCAMARGKIAEYTPETAPMYEFKKLPTLKMDWRIEGALRFILTARSARSDAERYLEFVGHN